MSKTFAQIRGDEILHLSYNQRAEEIERLNKHIDMQAVELERYETARQEDARRLEQVKGERDAMREALKVEQEINDAFYEYGLGIWDTYVSDRIIKNESFDHYRSARPFEATLNAYCKLERVTAKSRDEYRKRRVAALKDAK